MVEQSRYDKSVAAMHKALDAACASVTQEAVDRCFADAPREVRAALPATRVQLVAGLRSSIMVSRVSGALAHVFFLSNTRSLGVYVGSLAVLQDEFQAIMEESGLEGKLRRLDALCAEHDVSTGADAATQCVTRIASP